MATKEELLAAGFTEDEVLREAGFTDEEIKSTQQPQTQPPWWVKPAQTGLETVGLLGGGVLGSSGGPLGTVAGAGLGYGAAKQAGKGIMALLGKEKPETIPEAFTGTGQNILEGMAMEMGGQLVPGALKVLKESNLGKSLYARAMKIPPGSVREEVRGSIIKTLQENERLPLGKSTRKEINKIVGELDDNISNTLNNLESQGQFDINIVSKYLDGLKSKFSNYPDADKYYNVIDRVKNSYIEHDFVKRGATGAGMMPSQNMITLADAQALKKGTYAELEQYYAKGIRPETGRVGIKNNIEAAAKARAASTLRRAIVDSPNVPDSVRTDLSREAGLMEARKWVERAVNRGQNLDPISLGSMAFGVLIDKGIPGALAYRIAVSQPVLSRIAIGIGKLPSGEISKNVGRGISYGLGISMTQKETELP